ncbi:MAG: hypothetical protein ABSF09_11945 [Candidatus Bathyarchaeia archaeon]|jgi:hypothetical protein
MEIWGFNPRDYDSFQGIIVIKDYPPINEYKGVRIVSVQEIDKLAGSCHS